MIFLYVECSGDILFDTMGDMAVCLDELSNHNLAVGLFTR